MEMITAMQAKFQAGSQLLSFTSSSSSYWPRCHWRRSLHRCQMVWRVSGETTDLRLFTLGVFLYDTIGSDP